MGIPVYSFRGGWPQMTGAKVYGLPITFLCWWQVWEQLNDIFRHHQSNQYLKLFGNSFCSKLTSNDLLARNSILEQFSEKMTPFEKLFWNGISFLFILNWTKFDFKNQLIWNGLIFIFFKILKWATLRHLILKILRKHFETQTRLEK